MSCDDGWSDYTMGRVTMCYVAKVDVACDDRWRN